MAGRKRKLDKALGKTVRVHPSTIAEVELLAEIERIPSRNMYSHFFKEAVHEKAVELFHSLKDKYETHGLDGHEVSVFLKLEEHLQSIRNAGIES